ncbi:MAG: ABC transporter permease [Planctomycetota bacterium]
MIAGKYAEMVSLGVRNILGYPLRSFLTVLGISIGIAAVVAMFATATGAEREILEQFGRLGIKNIIVNSVKPPEKTQDSAAGRASFISRYGLTFRDRRQIAETVPTVRSVLPVHTRRDEIWVESRKVDGRIHGVRPEHMEILRLDVVAGRNLTPLDNLKLNRVCVVRSALLRELGFYGEQLGHMLQVGGAFYEIVGILREEEFTGHVLKALNVENRALEIYAPYETVIRRHGTTSFVRKPGQFEASDVELHQIVVEVDEQENVLPTARMIARILEHFHRDRDYEMVVPVELIEQKKKTQQTLSIVLIIIAFVSLIVGGIGIANIMLATITERTREIGVRRAIGAKKRHIVAQFLTETVTLAVAGGILGLFLGVGFLILFKWLTGWPAVVPAYAIVLAIGISCLVGVAAGIWPATRAANMDPIGALRHE